MSSSPPFKWYLWRLKKGKTPPRYRIKILDQKVSQLERRRLALAHSSTNS